MTSLDLTQKELFLLHSWTYEIKRDRPNYYNQYAQSLFSKIEKAFQEERNKVFDKIDKIAFEREYECKWID